LDIILLLVRQNNKIAIFVFPLSASTAQRVFLQVAAMEIILNAIHANMDIIDKLMEVVLIVLQNAKLAILIQIVLHASLATQ